LINKCPYCKKDISGLLNGVLREVIDHNSSSIWKQYCPKCDRIIRVEINYKIDPVKSIQLPRKETV
jgi:uncharacterized protein with PIN domain